MRLTTRKRIVENYCFCCGKRLSGSYHTTLKMNRYFCSNCANRFRCFACNVPVNNSAFRLDDGRYICSGCWRYVVKTDKELERFAKTVIPVMRKWGFGIGRKIRVCLCNLKDLSRRANTYQNLQKISVTGLFEFRGAYKLLIYILSHMLPDDTAAVMVHELTHAWQSHHDLLTSNDDENVEGFADYVGYSVLKHLGVTGILPSFYVGNHPYETGCRAFLKLEKQLGRDGVFEFIRNGNNIRRGH